MSARHRIYAETLPFATVTRPDTVGLLRRYGLEIVLAVRPHELAELTRAAVVMQGEGVPLVVWPMLSDDEGRWANAKNAVRFVAFARAACDALERAGAPARDVLFDMEPPLSHARTLADAPALGVARMATRSWRVRAFAEAERVYAAAADELRARGARISLAVWPLVGLDAPGARGWQSVLGTPVDALRADEVSVMMYTSIVAGWSRGAVRRTDAAELLAGACARVVGRWGDRGGISLGCVGTGAFGDEPVYASPRELAEDAAIAREAGCSSIALFDLGGVLARAPAEAWLDALVDESAHVASPASASRRVAAARRLARAATWVLTKT